MQRWVQNHGEFVVHANEVLEGYEQLPIFVRPRYVLQLLGKHRPKYIVGEVEASHQPVELTGLELAHLGHFAGVEEELHQLALKERSWGWVRGRGAYPIGGGGRRVKLLPGEAGSVRVRPSPLATTGPRHLLLKRAKSAATSLEGKIGRLGMVCSRVRHEHPRLPQADATASRSRVDSCNDSWS